MKIFYGLFFLATFLVGTYNQQNTANPVNITKATNDKMLLVLSAPFIHDKYYKETFLQIVNFQIEYAKAIIGNDNVVVLVDKDTQKYYENKLPNDVLLTADVYDIWMRDFTTINPINPVQFTYTWASMTKTQSIQVQNSFEKFANKYKIERQKTKWLIDGGNIVDNYAGKIITTTKFMTDNNLSYNNAKKILKNLLRATEVAIIKSDEDRLAHSDGMVSWVDNNTLFVNDYSYDTVLRNKILAELKTSFPTTKIIEVPIVYKPNLPGVYKGFESACGVNVNSTVTFNNIYVPLFNLPHEKAFLDILKNNTSKKIITINANAVCPMGGSVRCLTWQLTGKNAQKLIAAAKIN